MDLGLVYRRRDHQAIFAAQRRHFYVVMLSVSAISRATLESLTASHRWFFAKQISVLSPPAVRTSALLDCLCSFTLFAELKR